MSATDDQPNVVIPLPGSERAAGLIGPTRTRSGDDQILMWVPVPLSAEQWGHFRHVIDVMRPGLVQESEAE